MRFSCQSCAAKYSIPDERVEGKVIRLKCQKCQAEIIVRGPAKPTEAEARTTVTPAPPVKPEAESPAKPEPPAKPAEPQKSAKFTPVTRIEDRPAVRLEEAESDNAFGDDEDDEPRESTRIANLAELENMRKQAAQDSVAKKPVTEKPKVAKKPPPPPPPEGAEWLVLISGKQQGPFTVAEILAKAKSGEIHHKSYLWKEGMADWLRASQLPEFAAAFAPEAPAKSEGAPKQEESFDQIFGPRGVPPPLEKPSAVAHDAPEMSEPNPSEVSDGHLLDESNELSLHDDDGPPRESTKSLVAASGLTAQNRKKRIYIIAAAAVGAVILTLVLLDLLGVLALPGMGTAYDTLAIDNPHAPPASQPTSSPDTLSEEEKARLREGLLGKKPAEHDDKAANDDKPRDDTKAQKPSDAPAPTKDDAEKKLLADVYNDTDKVAVRIEAPTIKTPEKDLPTGITPAAITEVVTANQKAVRACLERELKRGGNVQGKLEVAFTIAPAGTVSEASVSSEKFKGTELANCVTQSVRGWKFPRFSGEAVPVEYPFILSSGM